MKHYNKVLGEQLSELKGEIERMQIGFQIDFGLQVGGGLRPHQLGQVLEHHHRQLQAEMARQQRELRMLADLAATKRWLKRQRQSMREAELDFELF